MRKKQYSIRRKLRRRAHKRFIIISVIIAVAFVAGVVFICVAISNKPGNPLPPSDSMVMTPPDNVTLPEQSDDPYEREMDTLSADVLPYPTDKTHPDKLGLITEIMVGGEIMESYTASDPVTFGSGKQYTNLEGIITFRGNNYRDMPSFGTVNTDLKSLEIVETKKTGKIGKKGGATYTGQPLIVKWPEKTRKIMTSLYQEYRDKDDFVEVIYATLSGHIYFMDLYTGELSREPIATGAPVTGTASIDPRGYPVIYVGQGLQPDGRTSGCKDMYMRAFSLIDGSLLLKYGWEKDDPFAHRGWQAYGSSPLIDGKSDTLIMPGENGVLYVCRLNTVYDEQEGIISMDKEPLLVKYRYTSSRNKEASIKGRWGTQSSAVAWRDNLIFADNAGILSCINLNTLELLYANDLSDDSDMTMVLEEDAQSGTFYLYSGCNYDPLVRPLGDTGEVYARKLDGVTGEVVLEKAFTVKSDSSSNGGILASPVLGMDGTDMENLIIFGITQEAFESSVTSSLVALDKATFKQVWKYDMQASGWSPSSPVPVYTKDGKGYIVQCYSEGDVVLVDGLTGKEAAKLNVGEPIEATPAIYDNMIVVASTKANIFFIRIS